MVKRNFLLGRDCLISICCDIFWKPISSIMGNGCRSRAIISVIYEQCKQMVFWIFGFFPKTSCKLSCCILLHEKPLIPGKGMGWLRIWLCTWKPGHAANLQKAKKLFFFFKFLLLLAAVITTDHAVSQERESQIPGLEGEDVSLCYGY